MSFLVDIAPADFGLPQKFREYRPGQSDAIEFAFLSTKAWVAAHAPTGIGKSLLGVTVAKLKDSRAVYLTATKALQDQISTEFELQDVRGRANYPCRVYTKGPRQKVNCEQGSDQGCSNYDTTGCPYSSALFEACQSELASTNYSFWLHIRRSQGGTGLASGRGVEMLICDEAHHILEELNRFLQISIPEEEYENTVISGTDGLMSESGATQWRMWSNNRLKDALSEMRDLKDDYGSAELARAKDPRYLYLERLAQRLKTISGMDKNWTWELTDKGVSFDPIWPGQYAHLLWSGVPQILLLSATLCRYTLSLLGLSSDLYDYREFRNGWPDNHALVWYIPTAKMSYKSTEADHLAIASQIDAIIGSRLDRKGIIHTVSYKRMRTIMGQSKYARYMHFNESSSSSTLAARRFREAKPPAILISPSFSTGWDFPFDQCEYQIIPKVPFPYAETRVMKERNKDERYRIYCAILELIQMIGRGRRAAADRCETFILDKNFPLVYSKGKQYAPHGFKFHRRSDVPPAPRKLLIAS